MNNIKQLCVQSNYVFAPLDATSLFTSIPIQYACEIVDQNGHLTFLPVNDTNTYEFIEKDNSHCSKES